MTRRFFIFTNAISRKNGGSSSILDLANGLVSLGFEVVLFTSFGAMDKYIYRPTDISDKLKVSVLPIHIFSLLTTSRLKRLLNRICDFRSGFYKYSFKDAIVLDGIGLTETFIKKLMLNNCKVIYNHAGSPNAEMMFFGRNGERTSNLKQSKELYLEMINVYTHILFQSPTQAKKLNELRAGKKDITLVLRPSVSMRDIEIVKNTLPEVDSNNFNIVVVGSVQERKGQHLLPEVVQCLGNSIPNLKIHIVGPIIKVEYKKSIDNLVKKYNQEDCIFFHGFQSNYLDYMNSADIILQVSEEEGVSRVLREAMALQKVIVSFRLDGTSDLLVDGEDCLLSDFGDIERLSNNILNVYRDKSLFEKLSKNALLNFESKYSKKEYLSQLDGLMKKLR